MITTMFNSPRILWQPTTNEGFTETAIGASVDAGGTIVLEQEGRHIVIDPEAVPELRKLLNELAVTAKAVRNV